MATERDKKDGSSGFSPFFPFHSATVCRIFSSPFSLSPRVVKVWKSREEKRDASAHCSTVRRRRREGISYFPEREERGACRLPRPSDSPPSGCCPSLGDRSRCLPPPLSPYAHTWYCTVFSSPRASIKREGGIHTQKRQISPLKGEGGGEREKNVAVPFFPFLKASGLAAAGHLCANVSFLYLFPLRQNGSSSHNVL